MCVENCERHLVQKFKQMKNKIIQGPSCGKKCICPHEQYHDYAFFLFLNWAFGQLFLVTVKILFVVCKPDLRGVKRLECWGLVGCCWLMGATMVLWGGGKRVGFCPVFDWSDLQQN